MLHIIDVDYVKDYILSLKFNVGVSKTVDLLLCLTGEIFYPLLDKHLFIQYGLTKHSIEWVNGADLVPEFLYELPDVEMPFDKEKA